MAFSMKQVSNYVESNRKKFNAKPFFAYINDLTNVSTSVKKLLSAYLRRRLKLGNLRSFTMEKFKEMLKELLENCCDKDIFDITPNDTDANYDEILYQLKYAIDKKFMFVIYHNETIDIDNLDFKKMEINNIQSMTQNELDNFFEGVIFR